MIFPCTRCVFLDRIFDLGQLHYSGPCFSMFAIHRLTPHQFHYTSIRGHTQDSFCVRYIYICYSNSVLKISDRQISE